MLEELSEVNNRRYERQEKLAKPYIQRLVNLKETYNIDMQHIAREKTDGPPPWSEVRVRECKELYRYKKNNGENRMLLHQAYLENMVNYAYTDVFYTDGSNKTEHGVGYAGVHGREVEAKKVQGYASVYTAELLAVLGAVKATQHSQSDNITIATDSRSAIAGICKYNNNHPIVRKIFTEMIRGGKNYVLCWVPSHVCKTK